MHVVDVDVVGAEAFERGLKRLDEVVPRGADVICTLPEAEGGLGGDEDVFATQVLDRGSEDGLAGAEGVDVGGIEEVEAGRRRFRCRSRVRGL
jgi:hypothetical protein